MKAGRNAPKRENKNQKRAGKWEELSIRNYFVRLFGKYDFRNEQHFLYFGKWMVLLLLLSVELWMMLHHFDGFFKVGQRLETISLSVGVLVLTVSEICQLFVVKSGKGRMFFYVIDAIVACSFVFFAGGTYPLIIYMLVLTEFYIGVEKTRFSFTVFLCSMPLYAFCYGVQGNWQWSGFWELFQILGAGLGPVFALAAHFIAVHIALAFYRQFLKLDRALAELDESKKELEKAYAVVAEVTALEERQRIAKEIHDTAGHSLTTVIMQTEAAKRILETAPEEAKAKIVAANLQAKHALEELRDSVHLLSGSTENKTLKDALLGIIHESTDGTGIIIRSEIDDTQVSPAKFRFLCNTLKEGISNGLRHGGATAFWFELKEEDGNIRFLLSDNGKGAPKGIVPGFGLTTMQDRAKSLGGEVGFDAEEDEGFELRLTLPMDAEVDK